MNLNCRSHGYRKWVLVLAMAIGVAVAFAQPPSYDDLVGQARKQIDATQFAAAVASGRQAIALDKARWEGYLVVGVAENEQKHYDLAVTAFSQSLAFAPDDKKSGVQQLLEKAILAKNGGAVPPSPVPAGNIVSTPRAPSSAAVAGDWEVCLDNVIGPPVKIGGCAKEGYLFSLTSNGSASGDKLSGTWRFDGNDIVIDFNERGTQMSFRGPWQESGGIRGDLNGAKGRVRDGQSPTAATLERWSPSGRTSGYGARSK